MRLRKIKQYGNSFFIALKPIDMEDLGLDIDDEVDIDDVMINKKKEEKQNEKSNELF